PLCSQTFTAPALPPASMPPVSSPPSASSSAREDVFNFASSSSEPAVPKGPPEPAKSPVSEAPPSAPALPGYQRTASIWVSPRIVPWIGPIALVLVFVLSFLTWLVYIPPSHEGGKEAVTRISSWGLAFGKQTNALSILYLLFLMVTVLLALASVI